MSDTSNRMLRVPKELEEEFGRICKMIGISKNAATNMLIAEMVLKYQSLEFEEKQLPAAGPAELAKKAIGQALKEQKRINKNDNESDTKTIPKQKKKAGE